MRKSELPRSILIIRLSEPGDIILSSPVATALKASYPNATITYVTDKYSQEIAASIKNVDHVITWDSEIKEPSFIKKAGAYLRQLQDFRNATSDKKFETCIDMQGTLTSGALAFLSGAKHRIGLDSQETNSLFMTKTISTNTGDKTQIGAEYRYMIDQLGIINNKWKMSVPHSKTASEKARAKIHKLINDDKFAIICPSADTPQKHWKEEYWQQLSLRIRGRYHLRCLILGDQKCAEENEKLARGCGATNITGEFDLSELSEAIRLSQIVIGTDNYFTHASVALKKPTIALFGATCPYTFTEHDSSRIIYKDKHCSPCHKKPSCNNTFHCMTDISPDQVLTDIKALLANKATK